MASWARRSLAAETIFMALVICCVFLVLRIRRRMSMSAGMAGFRWLGLGLDLEGVGELREGRLELVRELALDVLLLRDLLEQVGMPRLQEGVELLLVAPGLGHRVGVQVAVGGRVDDRHLLLHGQWRVLILLQD